MSMLQVHQTINSNSNESNTYTNNINHIDIITNSSFRHKINNPQSIFPSDYRRFCQPFYDPYHYWLNAEALPIFKQFTSIKYEELYPFDLISINQQFPMAQFITDVYTQCFIKYNWSINDFMEQSQFLSSIPKTTKVWRIIRNHLSKYHKYIMKHNPFETLYRLKQRIMHYMSTIHDVLRKLNIMYQLDVIFVPEHVTWINDTYFHQNGMKYDHISHESMERNLSRMVRSFLRDYGNPYRRCCVLIMASESEENDEMFIFEPLIHNTLPKEICNYTELPWIYNTKTHILPGFKCENYKGFCISFHRHGNAQRVYISSSGSNTMRVFKHNVLCDDEYDEIEHEFKDDAFMTFVDTYFDDLKLFPSKRGNDRYNDTRNEDTHNDKWPKREYDYTQSTDTDREKEREQETNDELHQLITFKASVLRDTEDTDDTESENDTDGSVSNIAGDLYSNIVDFYPDKQKAPSFEQIKALFEYVVAANGNILNAINAWCESMMNIISDLRGISGSLLWCLFYTKEEAVIELQPKAPGTFMMRLSPNQNELEITYKSEVGNVPYVVLRRVSDGQYTMDGTNVGSLYDIIMNHDRLKYVYTPYNDVPKTNIFINPKVRTYNLRPSTTEHVHAFVNDISFKCGTGSKETHKNVRLRVSIPDKESVKELNEVNMTPSSLRRTSDHEISEHHDKCMHYLQLQQTMMPQSYTVLTDIDDNEPFDVIVSDVESTEPEPDSPICPIQYNDSIQSDNVYADIDDCVIVCPRDGGHNRSYHKSLKQSNNKGNGNGNGNDASKDGNNNNKNRSNDNKGNGKGSGSGSNGDDDKKDDNKHVDEKPIEYDSLEQRFCWLLMHSEDFDDNALCDGISSIGDSFSRFLHRAHQGLDRIDKMRHAMNDSKSALKQNQRTKPIPASPNRSSSELKQNKRKKSKKRSPSKGNAFNTKTDYPYVPSKIKFKYHIPKEFTQNIIPQKVKEFAHLKHIKDRKDIGKHIYEFMLKLLVINKGKNLGINGKKIFNFDLHDNDSICMYFIAEPRGHDKWIIQEILTEKDVISTYKVSLDVFPEPYLQFKDYLEEQRTVQQMIIASKEHIIKNTKWTKIPNYNDTNHERRLTLSVSKERFMECIASFDGDIKLIPIVLFGFNDKYWVEYVWIVSVEDRADVGISFRYNANNKSVKVSGIHLDKDLIFRQHHILSPAHECKRFDTFKSQITDLHIGNPDDDLNKIKDLKNQVQNLKNKDLNKDLDCAPLHMLRSLSNETSMDINPMDITVTPLTMDASQSIPHVRCNSITNAYGRSYSASPMTPALSNISNIADPSPVDIDITNINDGDCM